MNRFTLSPTAVESPTGNFIEILAVDMLREHEQTLSHVKRQLQGALRLVQSRDELTVVSILNLADCIKQEFDEPILSGTRYEADAQSLNSVSDGQIVRIQDAESLRDACVSLFDECEVLQDALRSEIHKSRHEYVFTWRGSQS